MTPARTVPPRRDGVRLLAVDPAAGSLRSLHASDLPALLAPGDLLVVNDAATLPASLHGRTEDDRPVEIGVDRALMGERDAVEREHPRAGA